MLSKCLSQALSIYKLFFAYMQNFLSCLFAQLEYIDERNKSIYYPSSLSFTLLVTQSLWLRHLFIHSNAHRYFSVGLGLFSFHFLFDNINSIFTYNSTDSVVNTQCILVWNIRAPWSLFM